MSWSTVTEMQAFPKRSSSKTPKDYTFGVSSDNVKQLCKGFWLW